jgi:hypothetical protein
MANLKKLRRYPDTLDFIFRDIPTVSGNTKDLLASLGTHTPLIIQRIGYRCWRKPGKFADFLYTHSHVDPLPLSHTGFQNSLSII